MSPQVSKRRPGSPQGSKVLQPRTLVWILLAATAFGCGTSAQLVNEWRDPTFRDASLHNVLVMGMSRDPARRRLWEDSFASELSRRGANAVPGYQVFPGDLPDTQQVIDAVRDRGYDGVTFTVRLPSRTETRYVPGYVSTVPVTYYSRWRGAYYTYWHEVYEPGYAETDRVVRLRTDVWDVRDEGRLVWTGTSEVIDPSSARDVNDAVTRRIVPELIKQGIVNGRT
jgi:hypothetical protein